MTLEKISTNCYKGEPITNTSDLYRMAKENRSVYHKNWGIKPAKVVVNMPFPLIMGGIEKHQFFYVHKI